MAAGIIAAVCAYYAITIGVDVAGILLRPANAGWIQILLMLFLPLFVGVIALGLAAAFLGRYAIKGRFF